MSARKRRTRLSTRSRRWGVALLALFVAASVLWIGCRPRPAAKAPVAEADWAPPHPSPRWECIVIHHSGSDAGGAERFDQYHRSKGWDELGYHFVIGNGSDTADGQVEVGPRWPAQKHGAHCKTPDEYYNQHGIGICLVGNFNNRPPSDAQLRSLDRLCRYLTAAFHIPPSRIYTHGGITGKTDCPGRLLDVDAVRLRAAATPADN